MGVSIPKNIELRGKSVAELQELHTRFSQQADIIKTSLRDSVKALAKHQRYQGLKRLCLRIDTELRKGEAAASRPVRHDQYRRRAA